MKILTFIFIASLLLISSNSIKLSSKKLRASQDLCDDFLCSTPTSQAPATFTISGYIKNAATNKLITQSDLSSLSPSITFSSSTNQYTATINASNSSYTVTLPAGTYQRNGSLTGYVKTSSPIEISASSSLDNNDNSIFFSPIIQGWRAVLTWTGTVDKDLDSYTKCPDGSLVSYKKKNSTDGVVVLDVDSRDSGPETTTLRFNETSKGTWSYWATSYRKTSQLINSDPKVAVYHGDTQVAEVMVENAQDGNWWWHVFDIVVNGADQQYQEVNRVESALA